MPLVQLRQLLVAPTTAIVLPLKPLYLGLELFEPKCRTEGGRRPAVRSGNAATAQRITARVKGGDCRELASTMRIPIAF